jgi:hypothetical protein
MSSQRGDQPSADLSLVAHLLPVNYGDVGLRAATVKGAQRV